MSILRSSLHQGEAEAIALATDRKADIGIVDEQKARQLAVRAGLSVTGGLGVLLRAKRSRQLSAVSPRFKLSGPIIAPALEAKILALAGEIARPEIQRSPHRFKVKVKAQPCLVPRVPSFVRQDLKTEPNLPMSMSWIVLHELALSQDL